MRRALARRPPPMETGFESRVSTPDEAHEREADRVAAQVMTEPDSVLTPFVPRTAGIQRKAAGGGPAAVAGCAPAGSGAPLSVGARGIFEPRFGRSLDSVRVHADAASADQAQGIDARAFTVGRDIYFGRGEYAPETPRGMGLLAHEITHTLQPDAAARVHRKTLSDIPDATRTKLRVSRVAPPQASVDTWIANYFNPKSGVKNPPSSTMEFGADITDANQQAGLGGVASELEDMSQVRVTPGTGGEPDKRTNTDPKAWPLPPGTILDLALDLRPLKGEHAIFRFTRYMDGTTSKILVEKLHVLAPAPAATGTGTGAGSTTEDAKAEGPAAKGPTTQPQAQAPAGGAAQSFTGDVRVGSITAKIDASFGDARGKQIADAIALLPDPIRAKVDGVTFVFMGGTKGPDGRSGDYNAEKDIIHIYGDMFAASPYRIGKGTQPEYGIVHELGHAIDLRPLMKAQRARDAAEETKKKLVSARDHPPIDINSNDPLAGLGDKSPARIAEEKRLTDEIKKVQAEIDAQNTAMASAKSVAGHELGDKTPSEQMLTDFAKAIEADGVKAVTDARKTNRDIEASNKKAAEENAANPSGPQKPMRDDVVTLSTGVTDYAMTDLMEAFAENFAIYILDEALLSAIRPKTFAFFVRAFPKTAPPPAAAGAKP